MTNKPIILAVAGSLRQHSFNQRVLKVAINGAEKAGAEVIHINLNDFPMPLYNADDQDKFGFNEHTLRLQALINKADGLLIATPSYNGSLPAVLKNAIDWTSRTNEFYQKSDLYLGKTAAILSASPGSLGGIHALFHLRDILNSLKVHVLPNEVAVTFVDEKFDGDSARMIEARTKQALEELGQSLVERVEKSRPKAAVSSHTGYYVPQPQWVM